MLSSFSSRRIPIARVAVNSRRCKGARVQRTCCWGRSRSRNTPGDGRCDAETRKSRRLAGHHGRRRSSSSLTSSIRSRSRCSTVGSRCRRPVVVVASSAAAWASPASDPQSGALLEQHLESRFRRCSDSTCRCHRPRRRLPRIRHLVHVRRRRHQPSIRASRDGRW